MSDIVVLNIICFQTQKQLTTLNNIWVLLRVLKVFWLIYVHVISCMRKPLYLHVACTLVTVHATQATLMSPGQAKHVYVDMYALNLFIEHSGERWWEQNIFCLFTKSILAKLSTWCSEHSGDISCSLLINLSHTDESWAGRNMCMWICMLWIYSSSTLENTD